MENLQSRQGKSPAKWWVFSMVGLSFAGFLNSAYLAGEHYFGLEVSCSLVKGCEQVLASSYTMLFGIPVALLGTVYYLAIFLSLILFLDRKKSMFLTIEIILSAVGFVFTLWLLFVQAFLLKSFCQYCLLSALFAALLFALSLYFVWYGYYKGFRRKGNI